MTGTKLDLSNCFDQHRLPKHYPKPFYQKQVERWFAGILDLQPCDASKLGRCVVCGARSVGAACHCRWLCARLRGRIYLLGGRCCPRRAQVDQVGWRTNWALLGNPCLSWTFSSRLQCCPEEKGNLSLNIHHDWTTLQNDRSL